MVVPPRQVLNEARAAAKAGDYALALTRYEYFFDRALQDQGEDHNYHGVRLSYCLNEWARLGEKLPAARERLEAKAIDSLAAFEKTSDPAFFRDFQAIRDVLGQAELVFLEFTRYHESDKNLARLALPRMWNRLVESKRWEMCSEYLGDPDARYELSRNVFVELMQFGRDDPSMGGEGFADQNKARLVRDVGNVLRVLRNTRNESAADRLEGVIAADLTSRGYPDLISRIGNWAAL